MNIFGDGLLEENNKTILKGLNQSVVAHITKDTVKTFEYDDYGNSSKKEGHGYNSEYKDETGFIYLRARHYDPSIARFVSVDNNYVGEEKEVNTQNRYVYTLNNPYKYVDRDGNKAKKKKPAYILEVTSQRVPSGRFDTYIYSNGQKVTNFVPNGERARLPEPVPKGDKGDIQPNNGCTLSETSRIKICPLKNDSISIKVYEDETNRGTTLLALTSIDNLYGDWLRKETLINLWTSLEVLATLASLGTITIADVLLNLGLGVIDEVTRDWNYELTKEKTTVKEAIYNLFIKNHGIKYMGFYTKQEKVRVAYLNDGGLPKVLDQDVKTKYIAEAYPYVKNISVKDKRGQPLKKKGHIWRVQF